MREPRTEKPMHLQYVPLAPHSTPVYTEASMKTAVAPLHSFSRHANCRFRVLLLFDFPSPRSQSAIFSTSLLIAENKTAAGFFPGSGKFPS